MSSSQTLQCKTGDRWWLKLSGESHPLIPPRNAMSFNTWNWVGCTIVESLLRGSQPSQPSWTRAPATLIHLQVWRDITQELGGTACPKCVLFWKCKKLFHFYCHLKVYFGNNFQIFKTAFFLKLFCEKEFFYCVIWTAFFKKRKCFSSLPSCRSLA